MSDHGSDKPTRPSGSSMMLIVVIGAIALVATGAFFILGPALT